MGAILRIILITILFFYAFSMIIKLIFKRKMRKLQQQMEQFSQDETKTRADEVRNPHVNPNIGEYTEFEEVE